MKVKVIDSFRDKYTDEVYEVDAELTVDEKRYEEIKNYVEKIKNTKNKENNK